MSKCDSLKPVGSHHGRPKDRNRFLNVSVVFGRDGFLRLWCWGGGPHCFSWLVRRIDPDMNRFSCDSGRGLLQTPHNLGPFAVLLAEMIALRKCEG